jgi:hypothetical protein
MVERARTVTQGGIVSDARKYSPTVSQADSGGIGSHTFSFY